MDQLTLKTLKPYDCNDGNDPCGRLQRRLAENLNGVAVSSESEIDPECLTSVDSAEALTGLDIKAPSLMLANLHLNHVALLNYGPYRTEGGVTMITHLLHG